MKNNEDGGSAFRKKVRCECGKIVVQSWTDTFCDCGKMLIDSDEGPTAALDKTFIDTDYKPYTPPPHVPPTRPEKPKSLRDEFAMAAITGIISMNGVKHDKSLVEIAQQISEVSYHIADALLEARKKDGV